MLTLLDTLASFNLKNAYMNASCMISLSSMASVDVVSNSANARFYSSLASFSEIGSSLVPVILSGLGKTIIRSPICRSRSFNYSFGASSGPWRILIMAFSMASGISRPISSLSYTSKRVLSALFLLNIALWAQCILVI